MAATTLEKRLVKVQLYHAERDYYHTEDGWYNTTLKELLQRLDRYHHTLIRASYHADISSKLISRGVDLFLLGGVFFF